MREGGSRYGVVNFENLIANSGIYNFVYELQNINKHLESIEQIWRGGDFRLKKYCDQTIELQILKVINIFAKY